RNTPLSVEEALRLRNKQAEPSRPVFLTKVQRTQLALERRQREVDEMRSNAELDRDRMHREHRPARRESRSPQRHSSTRYGRHGDSRDRNELRGDFYRPSSRRDRSPSAEAHPRDTQPAEGDRVLTAKEREAIRQRYLVGEQTRTRKQGSRVVFDWDASEDTTEGGGHTTQRIMFGRGHLAGTEQATSERKARGDTRHWREKPLEEMRDRDWRIFREDFGIACKGGSIPEPYRSWAESSVPGEILRVVDQIGYREPTPIQRQAIPVGLARRDLIGIAETGSGKTASFLIPMLARIVALPRLAEHSGPYGLVLAPTRELAQQIETETRKFARLGFRSVSLVGGHDIEKQAAQLRHGAEIIIATPGRLRDCLDRRLVVLNQCAYVVMDEADRMMDMGFEDDVNYILGALPADKPRQTTMFSATMPAAVERLARKFLKRPAVVTIGTAGQAVDTVEQRVEFVAGRRTPRLLALLRHHAPPCIVFVNQKKTADIVCTELLGAGVNAATLHGGKTQEQREHALSRLRTGDADVLVATDVAGRGIDIKDVSLVVNYEMSRDIEAYTHRIGRTGRAGRRGIAVTFVHAIEDRDVLYDLRRMVAASPVSRCPPELANHEAAQ
ncbi:P-loop containing nucleoside triphosphate hydrolase protein, partial [Coemansia spiralis]